MPGPHDRDWASCSDTAEQLGLLRHELVFGESSVVTDFLRLVALGLAAASDPRAQGLVTQIR